MPKDSPRRLLLELAAQAILLAVILTLVFAFGLPDRTHAPRAFTALILAMVMAVPAGYGGLVIYKALRRRR